MNFDWLLENIKFILENCKQLETHDLNVFEMRGHEKKPNYKSETTYFGEDVKRHHQGHITEQKIKQIPENLSKQHLDREELIISYTPEADPHEFIETMKEKIGNNTSPGTGTEKSMYNSIKYRNTINQNPMKFWQYVGFHWENSLRNTLKGTPDQGVDQLFGASNQDFIENFKMDKNSSRKK